MPHAELNIDGQRWEFPVIEGSEGEKGIDISTLRDKTGYITLDIGYQNSGSCTSAITFIDGDKGILRYRGIDIEELCLKSTFIETSYLLINGRLPTVSERGNFSRFLTESSMLHQDMVNFFLTMPPNAHPMAILSTMVSSLAIFYPKYYTEDKDETTFNTMAARLISKIRTIAAYSFKKSIGDPFTYPRHDLVYCANFLNMMFNSPVKPYTVDPEVERILNMLLIIHADHEQNCSTSTVRLVGSSQANLYSSISAGISALWGPLHGGANQQVLEMLEHIHNNKIPVSQVIESAKDKNSNFRLSGFGHRVYKNYDPRAKILKEQCFKRVSSNKGNDPLLDIALELEAAALKDQYFVDRKLYPNVDFYSGIIYRSIGIPTNMFTVMFAMGRMPGWIAQWKELHESKPFKIGRPRQIYTGPVQTNYLSQAERK